MLRHSEIIESIVYDCYKEHNSHHKSLIDQKVEHSKIQYRTHFKMANFFILTEFMWNIFIEFIHLANYLEMVRY